MLPKGARRHKSDRRNSNSRVTACDPLLPGALSSYPDTSQHLQVVLGASGSRLEEVYYSDDFHCLLKLAVLGKGMQRHYNYKRITKKSFSLLFL